MAEQWKGVGWVDGVVAVTVGDASAVGTRGVVCNESIMAAVVSTSIFSSKKEKKKQKSENTKEGIGS